MSKKRKNEEVSSVDQEQLMKDIKAMEKKAREEALAAVPESAPAPTEEEVLFDAWYAVRSPKIPSRHMKEILRADFTGRGLGNKATMEKWDLALEKYGVKLK